MLGPLIIHPIDTFHCFCWSWRNSHKLPYFKGWYDAGTNTVAFKTPRTPDLTWTKAKKSHRKKSLECCQKDLTSTSSLKKNSMKGVTNCPLEDLCKMSHKDYQLVALSNTAVTLWLDHNHGTRQLNRYFTFLSGHLQGSNHTTTRIWIWNPVEFVLPLTKCQWMVKCN